MKALKEKHSAAVADLGGGGDSSEPPPPSALEFSIAIADWLLQ